MPRIAASTPTSRTTPPPRSVSDLSMTKGTYNYATLFQCPHLCHLFLFSSFHDLVVGQCGTSDAYVSVKGFP